ncbi:MAG TPA: class I SAM-dependent methyltransferase [Nitrospiraceae bacterium]|nr:class I SAM-dependent methyltransferase [Nitrospiraceae bacterium]
MTIQPFDPVEYKAAQRQDWDAVAKGWKQWWKTIEQGAQPVSDRLVALAEIQPGHWVLDVATGIGEPAITAARIVGPTGRVVGIDQAPQMLAIARERAASLELPQIDFVEMDAEAPEFPAFTYHSILCRWGLMFLPNLAATLRKFRGLLKSEGRFAAAVWGPPVNVPLISVAMNTVRQQLQAPPPPPGVPGPFSLADVTVLEQAFSKAGFTGSQSERLTVTFEWASAEAYTGFQQAIAAPIQAMLANEPTERQERVWRAVTDAARKHADSEGTLKLRNEVICITARR